MPVTIPVGGGTFTAVEGETYILSPNTTGDIIFNGDASFNVVIDTDQTGGSDNQFDLNFLSGTDPTVTYAAGVDASSHQINASGDSLTINVGAGATVADFDATSVSGPSGFVLDLGDNVTVNGDLEGPLGVGAGSNFTFGSGVTVNGNVHTAGRGDASITAGDDLTVHGALGTSGAFAETSTQTVTIGNNATINGTVSFSGAESVAFTVGDDLSVNNGASFSGSGGDDTIIIGDNWFVDGSLLGAAGDDQFYLGHQASTTDSTNVRGDAGSDGITVAAPPGDETNFVNTAVAAGWVDNGDGTVSSEPGASFFSYGNHLYNSFEANSTIPCFTTGTQIEVAHGETVSVEDLAQGDMVMTADHGLQPIRWIGTKTIGAAKLAARENLAPIRIVAGALGGGMPTQDLLVSPQHRMIVRSKIAQHMFGEDEVLVAAKHLVLLDGIDVADDVPEVTYVHFLCDTHEIVFVNGAPSESLYTGPQALKSVSPEAVSEIMTIFPELADIDQRPLAARQIAIGRKGRNLAIRHMINNRPYSPKGTRAPSRTVELLQRVDLFPCRSYEAGIVQPNLCWPDALASWPLVGPMRGVSSNKSMIATVNF